MPDEEEMFPVARLVPVDQWQWFLWKVTYRTVQDGDVICTRYLVSTDTHIKFEAQEAWPTDAATWFEWTSIAEVRRPRQIGSFYGQRLDESATEAGHREAAARGLKNG